MDFITLNNKRRIARKQQKKALKRAIRESYLRDVQLGTDVEKKAVDRIISAMGRAAESGEPTSDRPGVRLNPTSDRPGVRLNPTSDRPGVRLNPTIQVGLYYTPCVTGTLCGGPVYGASEEYLKSKALIKRHLEAAGYFVQSWRRPDKLDNCDLNLDDWFEKLDHRSGDVELYEYITVRLSRK